MDVVTNELAEPGAGDGGRRGRQGQIEAAGGDMCTQVE